jgi:hypothetical protein
MSRLLVTSLVFLTLMSGCAGADPAEGNPAGTTAADAGSDAGLEVDAGVPDCAGCTATQGCLVVTVTRGSDSD